MMVYTNETKILSSVCMGIKTYIKIVLGKAAIIGR
jgi:hypothetical protein